MLLRVWNGQIDKVILHTLTNNAMHSNGNSAALHSRR